MEYTPGMISMKYDRTLDYPISMYDNLPYERNYDHCNARHIALYSGHIIKYYLCLNQEEKYKVDNRDSEILEILARIRESERERLETLALENGSNSKPAGITQEQIKTLLDDPEEKTVLEANPDDENEASPNAVDAFEGVEDW